MTLKRKPIAAGSTLLVSWLAAIACAAFIATTFGCSRTSDENVETVEPAAKIAPIDLMRQAAERGDWQEAWSQADAVMITHGEDPLVLRQLAKVAFAVNDMESSADLLVSAVTADEFQDAGLVQQAMIAMISVGKLVDGIPMLSRAVERHPKNAELRRWLFDFLANIEQRDRAREHGRALVKQRKMDFGLLIELGNSEQRSLENDSTDHMLQRNPDDRRPSIANARVQFDQEEFSKCQQTLATILDSHRGFVPANLLMGRVLADTGQVAGLDSWSTQLDGDYSGYWEYWMVLGDWAMSQQNIESAARAYWESTKRNPDALQAWVKLAASILQLESQGTPFDEDQLDSIQNRVELLGQLYELKERFTRTKRTSKPRLLEIIETLRKLGRIWEAEAWAAVGLTMEGDVSEIRAARKRIVSKMHDKLAWQQLEGHAELRLDLSDLELPSNEILSSNKNRQLKPEMTIAKVSQKPELCNVASDQGLNFFGYTRDDLHKPGAALYAELGCGGGAIDFDLDGWTDLYLAAGGGTPPGSDSSPNSLQRNLNGKFVDVTQASSTGDRFFGQGVAVGDVNADGFPDLFVLNYGPNRLYINNGDGTFRESSEERFSELKEEWSTSGAIADLDGDSLPDIVVLNYCSGFGPVSENCTDEASGITKSCAPIHFPAQLDRVFHANELGEFEDVVSQWEVAPRIHGRGLGVIVGTLDTTRGLDVYVANDMTNNHFYSFGDSAADGFRLVESALLRGLACDARSNAQASMGMAAADLDRDGDIDFYLTHFQDQYNTYFEQRGHGIWQDKTVQRGLSESTLPLVGFGTEAVDFDNDGLLELIVTNGHIYFPRKEDDPPYYQDMQIFRRSNAGGFESVDPMPDATYQRAKHAGRALWTIDFDRNHQTDVVVTHQTEPVALLANQTKTSNHWVEVQLRGTACGRDAIGTRVTVSQDGQAWMSMLTAGDGYLCSNERILRFGVGDKSDKPVSVVVQWPDGSKQTFDSLAVDQSWMLVQDQVAFQLAEAATN